MNRTPLLRYEPHIIQRAIDSTHKENLTWSTDGNLMSVYIPWSPEPLFTCEVNEVESKLKDFAKEIAEHVEKGLTNKDRWIRYRAHLMQKPPVGTTTDF